MKAAIYSETQLQRFIGELRGMFKASGYVRVTASDDKPRSLPQNAQSHVWYDQISLELGEDTPEGVKCFCKLHYGVPILRAADEDFRAMYDSAIRQTMTYEQKLEVMKYLPVTSIMKSSQLSRYLETMRREYSVRGVMLEFQQEAA